MNKHTPGPWAVGPTFDNDGQPEIIIEHQTPAGNLVVAVALGGLQGQKENARLIAVAPKLLEELRGAVVLFGHKCHGDCTTQNWLDRAEAVLSKASGELFNTEAKGLRSGPA